MQFIKKLFTRFFCWACEDFLIQRSNNMKDMFSNLDQHIVNRFAELEKTSWKIKTTKMLSGLKEELDDHFCIFHNAQNEINTRFAHLENRITDMHMLSKRRCDEIEAEINNLKKPTKKSLEKIDLKGQFIIGEMQNRLVALREIEKNVVAQCYSMQQAVNRLDKEKSKNDTTRKGNSPEAEG